MVNNQPKRKIDVFKFFVFWQRNSWKYTICYPLNTKKIIIIISTDKMELKHSTFMLQNKLIIMRSQIILHQSPKWFR